MSLKQFKILEVCQYVVCSFFLCLKSLSELEIQRDWMVTPLYINDITASLLKSKIPHHDDERREFSK